MRRASIRTLLTVAVAASLLAACGNGGDDPTTAPTDDATTTTAGPTDEPTTDEPTTDEPTSDGPTDGTTGPPFPADAADQNNESFESELKLVDIRVAEHPDFDRLVMEFDGEGEPGWRVGHVESAAREGSGEPIDLDGDAILQVTATHGMPDDMTGYYDGPQQFDPDTEVIDDVFVDGAFEGYTTVFLGLDEVEVFRVFALTEPSRLVVDVQDS